MMYWLMTLMLWTKYIKPNVLGTTISTNVVGTTISNNVLQLIMLWAQYCTDDDVNVVGTIMYVLKLNNNAVGTIMY